MVCAAPPAHHHAAQAIKQERTSVCTNRCLNNSQYTHRCQRRPIRRKRAGERVGSSFTVNPTDTPIQATWCALLPNHEAQARKHTTTYQPAYTEITHKTDICVKEDKLLLNVPDNPLDAITLLPHASRSTTTAPHSHSVHGDLHRVWTKRQQVSNQGGHNCIWPKRQMTLAQPQLGGNWSQLQQ